MDEVLRTYGGHERWPHGFATCCSALKRAFCSPLSVA